MRDPTAVTDGLPIDAVLPLDHITLELAQEIERLAPFGEGNPAVTFAARDITVEHDRTFGRKGEHREVTIADREGHTQKLIWWRGAEIDLPDAHARRGVSDQDQHLSRRDGALDRVGGFPRDGNADRGSRRAAAPDLK